MIRKTILLAATLLPFLVVAAVPAAPQEMQEQEDRAREQAEREKERREEALERVRERAERTREERDRDEELYQRATQLLDEGRWERAVAAFDQVAKRAGTRADGALYWEAYASNKQGQLEAAKAALETLRKNYANSRWLNDAKALEVEIRQNSSQPVRPENQADDDLKLLALNSLMNSDPESAVPILEKFVQGNNSPKLKQRALFVLAQSRSAKAREVLVQMARGKSNPDLQLKALEYLGQFGSKESRQALADIYASSTDMVAKRRILRTFMVAGERDRLVAAAKSESAPELRQEAIRQLGVMGAREEIWQLYQAESSPEVKQQILQSLFVSGSVDKMGELARNEKDPKLRRTAIRNLGIMGGRQSSTAEILVSLYAAESDHDVRKEVINALFIQHNAKALVVIARKETDPELKKEIVSKLSIMKSPEAIEFMMEILNK